MRVIRHIRCIQVDIRVSVCLPVLIFFFTFTGIGAFQIFSKSFKYFHVKRSSIAEVISMVLSDDVMLREIFNQHYIH